MRPSLLSFFYLFLLFTSDFSLYAFDIALPPQSHQLIEVVVDAQKDSNATLFCWEKDTKWHQRCRFDAKIGRNGIANGLGIFPKSFKSDSKKEGDGKSPSGLFHISSSFGYAQKAYNKTLPYLQVDKRLECVDDSNSSFYNQILNHTTGYNSFEKMRRVDNLYQYGLVIDHNPQSIKGAGSCIFVHIMRPDHAATAGCTALKKADLLRLLRFLDADKKPLFYLHLKH